MDGKSPIAYQGFPREAVVPGTRTMESVEDGNQDDPAPPVLGEHIRRRIGVQLQAMFEPVFDTAMDAKLAALIGKLDGLPEPETTV